MFRVGNAGLGEPVASNHQLAALPHPIRPQIMAVLAGFAQRFPGGLVGDNSDPQCVMLERQLQRRTGGSIGGQFAGNMANGLLVGTNNEGHADSTTHAAVSDGTITVRDTDKQQQNVDDLSRDVEHANNALSPIFDKEKEQNRLREAQLIGEIGSQAADIVRTQGDINGLKAAQDKLGPLKENATEKERADYMAELRNSDVYKAEMKKYGTGSALQQGIQAATAAVQGLAGGDMSKALAGASAPYLAEVIHNMTTDPVTGKVNTEANLMAHAVLGAV
ncbi:TPA: hypothetical protein PXQ99_003890, partial [Yersinia enterocolitica]|nr:hypothetical protein [Yersinia enterocolitica]